MTARSNSHCQFFASPNARVETASVVNSASVENLLFADIARLLLLKSLRKTQEIFVFLLFSNAELRLVKG